ncbi:EamA family transporter [Acinetobacter equi]|uniref:EamA family transporter n=1 Tax=Acinetobacter equi TaxID=1324350 RepID=UPI0009D7509F
MFRNFLCLFILLSFIFKKDFKFIKSEKLKIYLWHSVVGLTVIYDSSMQLHTYKLSNVIVFSYSSPIFIPLIAWLFLKEKITFPIILTIILDLIGVVFITKSD